MGYRTGNLYQTFENIDNNIDKINQTSLTNLNMLQHDISRETEPYTGLFIHNPDGTYTLSKLKYFIYIIFY
jgi:hypothetical protein